MACNDDPDNRSNDTRRYTATGLPAGLSLNGHTHHIAGGPTGADPSDDLASADTPTLIGPEKAMKALAAKIGADISAFPIMEAETEGHAAEAAVAMCRAGNALALMKGSLHTDELLKPVMQRDTGLRTARRISHVFIMDTPAYARTLLITDAAINITPDLEDKVHIVQNAIDLAHALGIPEPKVALLSAK